MVFYNSKNDKTNKKIQELTYLNWMLILEIKALLLILLVKHISKKKRMNLIKNNVIFLPFKSLSTAALKLNKIKGNSYYLKITYGYSLKY